jgi:hypothetical protein
MHISTVISHQGYIRRPVTNKLYLFNC